LSFLENYYCGKLILKDIGFDETARIPGDDIFIHYNKNTQKIELVRLQKIYKDGS